MPDFVTADDLTAYLAGTASTIVAQVQAAIRAHCGWHVAPEKTETLTLDGSGSPHLWLPSLQVNAVDSVVHEGITLDADDYDWSADGYIALRTYGWWSNRPRQVVVTLRHGYAVAPPDLVGVAVAAAARAKAAPAGLKREQAGSVALEYTQAGIALLDEEKLVLEQYRLPPRP